MSTTKSILATSAVICAGLLLAACNPNRLPLKSQQSLDGIWIVDEQRTEGTSLFNSDNFDKTVLSDGEGFYTVAFSDERTISAATIIRIEKDKISQTHLVGTYDYLEQQQFLKEDLQDPEVGIMDLSFCTKESLERRGINKMALVTVIDQSKIVCANSYKEASKEERSNYETEKLFDLSIEGDKLISVNSSNRIKETRIYRRINETDLKKVETKNQENIIEDHARVGLIRDTKEVKDDLGHVGAETFFAYHFLSAIDGKDCDTGAHSSKKMSELCQKLNSETANNGCLPKVRAKMVELYCSPEDLAGEVNPTGEAAAAMAKGTYKAVMEPVGEPVKKTTEKQQD